MGRSSDPNGSGAIVTQTDWRAGQGTGYLFIFAHSVCIVGLADYLSCHHRPGSPPINYYQQASMWSFPHPSFL